MVERESTQRSAAATPQISSIHDAAAGGDLEKVKALLKDNPDLVFSKHGIQLYHIAKVGRTPLHDAAFRGSKDVVELLLANKAEVNAKDNEGVMPLHKAAFCGHKDVAALLLANGAEVNAKDNRSWTPLHWAACNTQKDVAELLLANKAEVNAKDKYSRQTPLRLAMLGGKKDVAELLQQHGGHQ